MGMKGKVLAVIVGVACVAAIAVTAASGATRAEPGITSNSILIGGTFPLTGVASLYKTIPAAEKAYFDYINDTKGGVNGRKINFEILDDAYDPSKTVPLVQQLVQQDKVWAIFGSLGTAPGLATWDYTNTQKVPQVFLATGDSYWGFCAYKKCGGKSYPWTINWQPDYPGEAKQYGKYIAANMPTAKIGVLYQNDAYGKNYYAGLRVGLGAKKELIVDAESYDVTQTSLTQQILALKAKGADTFVIFATPSPTITALVTATKVGWKPTTFINNVSANRLFLLAAAGNGANVDGVISTSYVKSPTVNKSDPGMQLASQIIGKYAPALQASFDRGDTNITYGLGVAWTFVYALGRAGKNPTRATLVKSLHNMNTSANPFVLSGIKIQTSDKAGHRDNFPIEQEQFIKWQGGATGDWQPFGKLLSGIR
ncbi:MAG TPA: ABC transporter substrate-binding protein [Gaiellaceae bacterium]|jgi:ABC-type branched-subunit amino acid transport system substrate-binding protein